VSTAVRARLFLILPAGFALLAGLDAALLLLGLPAPIRADRLPQVHGMLMVFGFVGTLVATERAVALGAWWGYLSPAAYGIGGLLLVSPLDLRFGKALLLAGGLALVGLYAAFWRRQPSAALLTQAGGAVAASGAAVLWLGRVEVPVLLPWLVCFVVLTIAGERLELARVARVTARQEAVFLAAAGTLLGAAAMTLLWPAVAVPVTGLALLGLVAWLVDHDVARRTVHGTGLVRYLAACLLAGYLWLFVAGTLWALSGPVLAGPRYDAVVHAVFLGFTMSMIMAHAPIILPAVLRRPLPYHPVFWIPAVLLQLSLVLRLGVGDVRSLGGVWQSGAVANIVAVLVFAGLAAWSAQRSPRAGRRGSMVTGSTVPGPIGPTVTHPPAPVR